MKIACSPAVAAYERNVTVGILGFYTISLRYLKAHRISVVQYYHYVTVMKYKGINVKYFNGRPVRICHNYLACKCYLLGLDLQLFFGLSCTKGVKSEMLSQRCTGFCVNCYVALLYPNFNLVDRFQ
jgi:hypothetical protein